MAATGLRLWLLRVIFARRRLCARSRVRYCAAQPD